MNKLYKLLFFNSFLFLIVINGFSLKVNERVGGSSLQFLKLGKSAKAIAMGDAYVASHGNISSIYYNPAGTFSDHQLDLTVVFGSLIAGINQVNVAGKYKVPDIGDFALAVSMIFYGEQKGTIINSLGDVEEVSGGSFTSTSFEVIANYSRGLFKN